MTEKDKKKYDVTITIALLLSVIFASVVLWSALPQKSAVQQSRCCGGFCKGEIVWAAPAQTGYSLYVRNSLDYAMTWETEREIIALPGQTKPPWPSLAIWYSPVMSYTHLVWVEGENPPYIAHGYASMQDIVDREPWTVAGAISTSQYAQVWPAVRADDDGNLVAVWQQGNDRGGTDVAAFSNATPPNWNNWSLTAPCINDECGTATRHIRPDAATDGDAFEVVWAWFDGSDYGISHDRSADGGQTWSTDNTVISGTTPIDWPVIALDVPPPYTHVAWQQRSAEGDWDIYYAHPTVTGDWHSTAIAVGAANQVSPSIAISPTRGTTSTVYVVWVNEAEDAVYIAYKKALSLTFSAPINTYLPGTNLKDPIVLFNPASYVFVAADAEVTTARGTVGYAVVSNQASQAPEQGGAIVDEDGNPLGDPNKRGGFDEGNQEVIMQSSPAEDTPALSVVGILGLTASLSYIIWATRRGAFSK